MSAGIAIQFMHFHLYPIQALVAFFDRFSDRLQDLFKGKYLWFRRHDLKIGLFTKLLHLHTKIKLDAKDR